LLAVLVDKRERSPDGSYPLLRAEGAISRIGQQPANDGGQRNQIRDKGKWRADHGRLWKTALY
jgi:hypothetical protein